MIIKSLEMYNFRQYIGKQKIEFSMDPDKNVTVLIGINTSGKTTIVRAFEWCLYGKIGFEDSVLLNSNVRENMNIGDDQSTSVSVEFYHDDKLYKITRLLRYTCRDRRTEEGKIVVDLKNNPVEDLHLEYLQSDGQTRTPINRANITESMDRVLPKDLSDYFFFGGERISGITNRTDLTKAIRGLMRLDVLENARTHLSKVLKDFESNIDTKGDAYAEKMRDSLESYKEQKEALLKEKENAEMQVEYWRGQESGFAAELAKSNIEQVKRAQQERARITGAIQATELKINNAKAAIVDLFNNRPYAFFGMPAIKKSLELLERVKDSTECVPGMDQDSIDYLLHRGFCICGTKLDPGTIPHQLVMAERRKLPPEHIGAVVMNYKNKSEGYLSGSEKYCDAIIEKYKELRLLQRELGQLKDELERQSDLIIDDSDAKDIEQKRKNAHVHYLEAQSDLDQINASLGACDGNIKNCEAALDIYAKTSTKNRRLANLITYSQAVSSWLDETYREKENIVRTELQKRVNDNFSRMYHGERSIVIDDKYRVRYKDVKTEESDGLKAVKSFAFIATLVSMAKDKILDDASMKLGQVYPLVMDAPFSNVDEIHIDNICKILPHTANQVIMAVMKKDWDYASTNLNRYVGMSYEISKDKDAEGKEIDTSTHILRSEV